jgi:hypothetical protein
VIEAWKTASHLLGFEIVAPFTLREGNESIECVAFLPHFGRINGMVIGIIFPPPFKTDQRLAEFAKDAGIFYSIINTPLIRLSTNHISRRP